MIQKPSENTDYSSPYASHTQCEPHDKSLLQRKKISDFLTRKNIVILLSAGFLLAFALKFTLGLLGISDLPNNQQAKPSATAVTEQTKYKSYDGYLDKGTFFAKDMESLLRAHSCIVSKDSVGLAAMDINKEIFMVKEDTKVAVVPSGLDKNVVAVIIAEGRYDLMDGYTFKAWVSNDPRPIEKISTETNSTINSSTIEEAYSIGITFNQFKEYFEQTSKQLNANLSMYNIKTHTYENLRDFTCYIAPGVMLIVGINNDDTIREISIATLNGEEGYTAAKTLLAFKTVTKAANSDFTFEQCDDILKRLDLLNLTPDKPSPITYGNKTFSTVFVTGSGPIFYINCTKDN